MPIHVLIADDHDIVRSGLQTLFHGSEIHIVGEATSPSQAVRQTLKHRPDVVLMDIRMDHGEGLQALREIRHKSPETPVVVWSTHDNPTYIARSVALGAADYLTKNSSKRELIAAIRAAVSGQPPTRTGLMRNIATAMNTRQANGQQFDVPLTARELQVLRHLGLGLNNREIGQSMDISVETVKEHVQNVLRKLDLNDRTQAAVWAVRKGLA